jgi:methyl-accepting chemotaxis protein
MIPKTQCYKKEGGRAMKRTVLILVLSVVCLFAGQSPFGARIVQAANGNDYAVLANQLGKLLICSRLIIARNQDIINTHGARVGAPVPDDAPFSFKGLVPAVFGRMVGEEFVERTGISVKQTTLGKGRFGPRSVYNAPDEWERGVLKKFNAPSYPKGVGFGEFVNLEEGEHRAVYRYMLPLYIEAPCLSCHGSPADSPTGDGLDIAGHPMEGYKLGELRGGISVTLPVIERQAYAINSKPLLELEESQELMKDQLPDSTKGRQAR